MLNSCSGAAPVSEWALVYAAEINVRRWFTSFCAFAALSRASVRLAKKSAYKWLPNTLILVSMPSSRLLEVLHTLSLFIFGSVRSAAARLCTTSPTFGMETPQLASSFKSGAMTDKESKQGAASKAFTRKWPKVSLRSCVVACVASGAGAAASRLSRTWPTQKCKELCALA